jgi:hypothetical protein
MKLDEFLQNPTFRKYEKEVQDFKDEFIAEGCEAFLWPPFADKLKANEFTSSLANKKGKIKPNPHIVEFIETVSSLDNNYIVFIFPEDYSPKYLIVYSSISPLPIISFNTSLMVSNNVVFPF